MKAYPSIPGANDRTLPLGEPCIGFYKYDGSNLRWEWNKKRGFYKFGTRHRLFGPDEAPYNQAIELFLDTVGPTVVKTVTSEHKGLQDFICYTEFFGPSSFAGNHELDEPKELKLLDVWIPRKAFIEPRELVKLFGEHSWSPQVVYEGNFNRELIEAVRTGQYPLVEGMVCKGLDKRRQVWMAKIKTLTYLDRLKARYGADWARYE